MKRTPICFIHQWNDSVKLHINSFRQGNELLIWQFKGELETHKVPILEPEITVEGLNKEGVYYFWTYNKKKKEISEKYNVYVKNQSNEDIIDKALDLAEIKVSHKWQKEYVDRLKEAMVEEPSIPLFVHLYNFKNEKELEDYEEEFFTKLLYIAERLHNSDNICMNKAAKKYPVVKYKGNLNIKLNDADHFIMQDYFESSPPVYLKAEKDGTDINIRENILTSITSVNEEGDWLYRFIYYQTNPDFSEKLWDSEMENQSELEKAILASAELDFAGMEMTDEDIRNHNLINARSPYDYAMSAPVMEDIIAVDELSFTIPDYDMIEKSEKDFYLACREEDIIFEEAKDALTPIDNKLISLSREKNYVMGNQFFWIQSEDGKLVSKILRYDFDNEDGGEFLEKEREIQINIYKKHLISLIRRYIPEAENFVSDYIDSYAADISYGPAENVYRYLLKMIPVYYPGNKNKLMFIITEDHNSSFNRNTDFFENPVQYVYS